MLLSVENLGISFGGLRALDSVDLHVAEGAVTAIIGPNGAGKSTFFNLVSGFYRPTVGRLQFDGEDITNLPAHRVAARGMARTFQTTTLFAQATVSDYLFDKDKIFAFLNLDDNELFIYQRLYDLLARDVPAPDLVIYLQAPTDVLARRLRDRSAKAETEPLEPSPEYLRELNEAYQHFFFHYTATPLLVVETSQLDLGGSDEAVDSLIRQIQTMGRGTQYYVPRT